MNSVNPFTGEIIGRYDEMNFSELANILECSQAAFLHWKNTEIEERGEMFLRLGDLLENKKHNLGLLITNEMGKPLTESISEIEKCASACRYFAEEAYKMLSEEVYDSDASKSFVVFQPMGVVLAIMPWNFPFWQVFRFAAPALMAGNTGILKHASNVTGCALAIQSLFLEAGFPVGVFQSVIVGSSTIDGIIGNDIIKAVTLTGSEGAGISVGAAAGRNIKKCVLELGGSDPFIVLEDADLDFVSEMAVKSRFINSGQSCIAAKRFIVAEGIHDKFVSLLVSRIARLKVGNPVEADVEIGPLARIDLADEVLKQLESSIGKGAVLLAGGSRHENCPSLVWPALLINVKQGMPAFDEEIFGPVLSVIKAIDTDHAIEIANNSKFGLGASVWTNDLKNAERIALELESGAVFINGIVKSDPRLPFGGIKKSGFGRELSSYGIKEFVNIKTIWRR